MPKIMSFIAGLFVLSIAFGQDSNQVVATVNGKPITKEYFDRVYNQSKLFVSDERVTQKMVLNDLINRQLGIQRAKKNKLGEDLVVKEKMEDVLYHAQVSKDLENKLKKIVVTNNDVKKYYRTNKEYRTAHILLRVSINPSKEQEDAAMKKAIEIHQALKKEPAKFAEFANKYTQSNSSKNGGDAGYQPRARMAPEYYAAIKGQKVGYITPIVRTKFGYHIIKVLGVKKYKDIQTELYKKLIYDTKRDKLMATYFKDLRKNSKITVNKELLK